MSKALRDRLDAGVSVAPLREPVPLTTTHAGMCRILGIGNSTGWELLSGPAPEIESITIGRRRLPIIASINQFVERRRQEPHRRLADPPPGQGRRLHRVNRHD